MSFHGPLFPPWSMSFHHLRCPSKLSFPVCILHHFATLCASSIALAFHNVLIEQSVLPKCSVPSFGVPRNRHNGCRSGGASTSGAATPPRALHGALCRDISEGHDDRCYPVLLCITQFCQGKVKQWWNGYSMLAVGHFAACDGALRFSIWFWCGSPRAWPFSSPPGAVRFLAPILHSLKFFSGTTFPSKKVMPFAPVAHEMCACVRERCIL